jgi:hypothetical protein
MRVRCENKNCRGYPRYGGRGIKVCDRWQVFENFLADMGRRPSDMHSIDRYPDNDGNYEPENCRWATSTEQHLNKTQRKAGTHCLKGHEFTPENTYTSPRGIRTCRTCMRNRQQKQQLKGRK